MPRSNKPPDTKRPKRIRVPREPAPGNSTRQPPEDETPEIDPFEADSGAPRKVRVMKNTEMSKVSEKPMYFDEGWDTDLTEQDFPTVRETEQREFLRFYRKIGIPAQCCILAGIPYSKYVGWITTDDNFQKEHKQAKLQAADFVHMQSFVRGVVGYTETTETDKVDKWGNPYTETKRRNVYDSTALKDELAYRQPERKTRIEVSGNIPVKIIEGIDIEKDI